MERILFICTGNYYRSRFAEALFNHHATRRGLRSRAFSRGLAIHLVAGCGDLSPHAQAALRSRAINLALTGPRPVQLAIDDLEGSTRVIALRETEHRPMMREQFPGWADRILYWNIADLDITPPLVALAGIDAQIEALVQEVEASETAAGSGETAFLTPKE